MSIQKLHDFNKALEQAIDTKGYLSVRTAEGGKAGITQVDDTCTVQTVGKSKEKSSFETIQAYASRLITSVKHLAPMQQQKLEEIKNRLLSNLHAIYEKVYVSKYKWRVICDQFFLSVPRKIFGAFSSFAKVNKTLEHIKAMMKEVSEMTEQANPLKEVEHLCEILTKGGEKKAQLVFDDAKLTVSYDKEAVPASLDQIHRHIMQKINAAKTQANGNPKKLGELDSFILEAISALENMKAKLPKKHGNQRGYIEDTMIRSLKEELTIKQVPPAIKDLITMKKALEMARKPGQYVQVLIDGHPIKGDKADQLQAITGASDSRITFKVVHKRGQRTHNQILATALNRKLDVVKGKISSHDLSPEMQGFIEGTVNSLKRSIECFLDRIQKRENTVLFLIKAIRAPFTRATSTTTKAKEARIRFQGIGKAFSRIAEGEKEEMQTEALTITRFIRQAAANRKRFIGTFEATDETPMTTVYRKKPKSGVEQFAHLQETIKGLQGQLDKGSMLVQELAEELVALKRRVITSKKFKGCLGIEKKTQRLNAYLHQLEGMFEAIKNKLPNQRAIDQQWSSLNALKPSRIRKYELKSNKGVRLSLSGFQQMKPIPDLLNSPKSPIAV